MKTPLALFLTVGHGVAKPKGRRIQLNAGEPVSALAGVLFNHKGSAAWWCGSIFDGEHRAGDRWRAAAAIGVDVDYHDSAGAHSSIPEALLAEALERLRQDGRTNLIYPTPRGLRVVVVFGCPVTSRNLFERAAEAAASVVRETFGDMIRERDGLVVDRSCVGDFARLFYGPRARVAGEPSDRMAEVEVVRRVPWDAEDLAKLAPTEAHAQRSARTATNDGNGPVTEGRRNTMLTSLAGTMRRRGMTPEAIAAALLAENERRCRPPSPEEEVRRIAVSVGRYKPAAGGVTSRAAEWDAVEKFTDVGNSERLVRDHGEDLRYCWPWRKWTAWTGTHWSDDAEAEVFKRAKATARSILNEAAEAATDSEARRLANHGRITMSSRSLRAMIDLARAELPINPDALDRHPWALNVSNGTIDLRTGAKRAHKREDLLTKCAPVEYDPDAKAPEFERFLLEIMGNKAHLVAYLQRVLGYATTGDVREDAFWIFHGNGANGKSTLLGAIHDALGPDYAATLAPALLLTRRHEAHPAELADLFGKRLCYTHEIDEGRKLAEGIVKQLTGRDRIKARRMREDFWEFGPSHKIILSTNHRPEIHGADTAIWRRIRLLPFNESFEGHEDKKLPEKLCAERAGILAWLVRGAVAWYAGGLNDPPEVLAATKGYRDESDPIGDFLAEQCDVGDDLAGVPFRLKAGKLYEAFESWFRRERGGEPMSGTTFGSQLATKFTRIREEDGNWYIGLKLRADHAEPESAF